MSDTFKLVPIQELLKEEFYQCVKRSDGLLEILCKSNVFITVHIEYIKTNSTVPETLTSTIGKHEPDNYMEGLLMQGDYTLYESFDEFMVYEVLL